MKVSTASEPIAPATAPALVPCSMRELLLYFLRLGTFGFGGPIALAGYMQRDLVERRGWITGRTTWRASRWRSSPRARWPPSWPSISAGSARGMLGATLVGARLRRCRRSLMVLALSAVYVQFGGLPWMQGAFYGIGAAVIAIIARSAVQARAARRSAATGCSGRSSLVNAVVTALTESEILWIFARRRRRWSCLVRTRAAAAAAAAGAARRFPAGC